MKSKKKKRRSWKRLSKTCEEQDICDCGQGLICYAKDNGEGNCGKEFCPIWNNMETK